MVSFLDMIDQAYNNPLLLQFKSSSFRTLMRLRYLASHISNCCCIQRILRLSTMIFEIDCYQIFFC